MRRGYMQFIEAMKKHVQFHVGGNGKNMCEVGLNLYFDNYERSTNGT